MLIPGLFQTREYATAAFPTRPGSTEDKMQRAAEPTTVYAKGLSGGLYLDRPHEVAAYSQAWEQLQSMALSERESELLISNH